MSKSEIHGITGKFAPSFEAKRRYILYAITSDIERKERLEEKAKNHKSELGAKSTLKELLLKGFPHEEAKKYIQTNFKILKNEDAIIVQWIKELEIEIKKEKSIRLRGDSLDER